MAQGSTASEALPRLWRLDGSEPRFGRAILVPGVGIEPTRAFWALRILSSIPRFFAIFSVQRVCDFSPGFSTFRFTRGAENT